MKAAWRLVAFALAASAARAAGTGTTASLAVSREMAPAGAIAQVKVLLTEPMPISHGGATLAFDPTLVDPAVGIYLLSPDGAACGTAVLRNGGIALAFTSPGGTLGTLPGYPILTLAFPIKAGTPAGASAPVTIEAVELFDLFGLPQPTEVKPGSIAAGGAVAINNVLPGGGTVPPGQPFLILGTGFQPGAAVRIEGVEDLSASVLDGGTIQLTAPAAVTLDGRRVVVSNPDGTGDIYYSYLRSTPLGASADPLVAAVVPIAPTQGMADALVPTAAQPGVIPGFALENANPRAVAITLSLYTTTGTLAARRAIALPPGTRISRTIAEVFPGIQPGALRVTADLPVRVMGLAANPATGAVLPVSASATPAGF